MDLYEHQARELFEEHGIPVPRAEVTDSPKEAREIARRLGGRRRGQGAGEDRRTGQGGRREARRRPGRRRTDGTPDPRHGHQGPHRRHR